MRVLGAEWGGGFQAAVQVGVDPGSTRLIEVGDDTLDLAPEEPNWDAFDGAMRRSLTDEEFFAVQWRGTDYTQAWRDTNQLVPLVEAVEYLHKRAGLIPVFVPLSWEASGDVLAAVRMRDLISNSWGTSTALL